MAFNTLSDRLKEVAEGALAKCREQWGSNGLKIDAPIDDTIGWKPSFYVRPTRVLIVAVEVNDVLFPEILKIAAHDIEHYDFPVAIYQACALNIFQSDSRLAKVKLLQAHGFGLITVDEAGDAIIQFPAPPQAQHVAPERLEGALRPLTPRLKVKFRGAYATYQTNVVQGLQEAAQIIEALIVCVAMQAEAAGKIPVGTAGRGAADIVDVLYSASRFQNYRATLGGARSFLRTYRNPPSHPSRTPREANIKLRKCKEGFFEALRMASELRSLIQGVGYRMIIQ